MGNYASALIEGKKRLWIKLTYFKRAESWQISQLYDNPGKKTRRWKYFFKRIIKINIQRKIKQVWNKGWWRGGENK